MRETESERADQQPAAGTTRVGSLIIVDPIMPKLLGNTFSRTMDLQSVRGTSSTQRV